MSIEIPRERLVFIECKRYKSKVKLSDMLVSLARIDDISKKRQINVTGAFFTTLGYTKSARKVGNYYNIDLNTAKDAKYFAVQICGNALINSQPMSTIGTISGDYFIDG